ncbi:thioesterase domain-containing protein [Uruburuella testudinis]|uniref:Thioesterase domain-containing protein n=1 Tax=Uruburuella testudinis TaxID=1282863 RepID=A0ABY4DS05_9NEIS|nr:YiiD C-terminal domain-containing protein [Uruburuella testudinis]UOO81812.1 thioesterase domain-containing protein [Uruburuella testudinis]
MTATELQTFLHHHIPATAALGVAVLESRPEKLVLQLPFAANRNHHNTVFGGSMVLAGTVCGWAAVFAQTGFDNANIVIQESHIRYLKPAKGALTAVCRIDETTRSTFGQALQRSKRARLALECGLWSEGVQVAVFGAKYVAFAADQPFGG